MFFDEGRFGTHTKLGYGWFKKGKRTQIKIKIGYKAFYAYSAIDINTGSNLSASFPLVNTECMSAFLQMVSENYPDEKIAMILDGAGWHRSKYLEIPTNIKLFFLPPYSPELNPVERFWKYLKQNVMINRIFQTAEELESALQTFLDSLKNDTILKLCKINYLDD